MLSTDIAHSLILHDLFLLPYSFLRHSSSSSFEQHFIFCCFHKTKLHSFPIIAPLIPIVASHLCGTNFFLLLLICFLILIKFFKCGLFCLAQWRRVSKSKKSKIYLCMHPSYFPVFELSTDDERGRLMTAMKCVCMLLGCCCCCCCRASPLGAVLNTLHEIFSLCSRCRVCIFFLFHNVNFFY